MRRPASKTSRPVRTQFPDPPDRPETARRAADPAAAHPPPAARQAASDRTACPSPTSRSPAALPACVASTTRSRGDMPPTPRQRPRQRRRTATVTPHLHLRIARPTTGGRAGILAARALAGVEHVTDRSYARTVQLGRHGLDQVTRSSKRHALMLELTPSLMKAAGSPRVRALRPQRAAGSDLTALRKDARLAASVRPIRACAGRVQRIRDGSARNSRPTSHGEGGNDHRVLVRRSLRRSITRHSPNCVASRRCRPASPPPASTTSRATASSRRVRAPSSSWRSLRVRWPCASMAPIPIPTNPSSG